MAVTAKKNDNYEYAPTRVYSYSRSSTAPAVEPAVKPKQNTGEKKAPVKQKKTAVNNKPHILKTVVSVSAVAAIAAVMIFVITRYAAINSAYAAVNDLKDNITKLEQDIETLNVQLNTSVNIEAAREAALNAGMGYPAADQVVSLEETGDITNGND
ncbi:MAG: hypothetical protein IJO48_04260 [Clostridia bacterium]|nr:hypothetical protein [Clostridia bacterium]